MRWQWCGWLLVLWLAQGPLRAAEAAGTAPQRWQVVDRQDLSFERLPQDSGLSQTRAAQILQDDQGFLWFGTQHGLSRYDGYTFKVFVNEPGRPESLGGVFIYALFKDRAGTLWVGTDQTLDRYDAATETFHHYPIDSQAVVTHISEDPTGALWLATAAGLIRLDPRTGAQQRYGHDDGVPDSLSSSSVRASGLDRQGTFWVATAAGLDAFDPASGTVRWHVPLPVPVREFSFHEDREGTFWVAYGTGNGLAILDRRSRQLTRVSFRDDDGDERGLTGVFSILEASDGTMWFATMGSGLLRLDREGRDAHRFVRYRWSPGRAGSLAENRAIALAEDREGGIWVGLHALPPNRFAPRPSPFRSYLPGQSDAQGMAEPLVNSVFAAEDGRTWLAAGGALQEWDPASGAVRVHRLDGPTRHVEVLAIADAGDGWLWLGTLGNGLMKFNRRDGQVRRYFDDAADPRSPGRHTVTRLLKDRRGLWWLATWNGLWRMDPKDGSVQAYHRGNADAADAYFSLALAPDGRLWLGSTTGLHRFDPATGTFESFRHVPDRPDTLSNDTVNGVFVDRAGTLWAATQNGLNRFDARTSGFERLFKADGLPGNAVSCVLQDDAGALWISTNEGLARFDADRRSVQRYTVADGLPGNDLTAWGACHRGPDGHLHFGGFAGALAFDPAEVNGTAAPPGVLLTELRLAGRQVQPGPDSPLQRSICFADPLVLAHSQNDLSVQMTALSFARPASNRYRHRLEGLDDRWREGGPDQRTASFVGLPPGDYVLQMQAATSHGEWSEPGIRLPIRVLAPWWRTRGFLAGTGLVLGLLLWGGYRARLRHLARQYDLRLDERLAERTRIARELHDSLLQGVQALLFQLQAVRQLLPDRPDAALPRLDRALDRGDAVVEEARAAVFDLRHAPDERQPERLMDGVWEELVAADERAARIDLSIETVGRPFALPAGSCEEVRRIVSEALRNVIQHAQARRIELRLEYGRDGFVLTVADDGVGVAGDADPIGHWGMRGMHERALGMGGELMVGPRPGGGTQVMLRLPGAPRVTLDRPRRARPAPAATPRATR